MDQNRNHRDLKWIFLSALMILLSVAIICGTSVLEKAIDRGLFDKTEITTPDTPDTPATKVVKTGMAIMSSASSSKAATADAAGTAQVDSTLVGVILVDGKIAACEIDTVQGKVSFNAAGEITTELGTEFKTKTELGEAYGMVANSSIGKEWFEQADALEAYVVGMTIDEVKAIGIGEDNKATDDDLKAGCTIKINGYIDGIVAACENAKEMGANADDELAIAMISKASTDSKNATADAAGTAQIDTNFAVVTTKDGKVTSVLVDSLQAKVPVNADGTIGEASLKTKKELGYDYNMKTWGNSSIGKEWFEQAEAFEKAASGGYEDLKISAEGKAEDDDLKAGCTINLYPFTNIINKALGK